MADHVSKYGVLLILSLLPWTHCQATQVRLVNGGTFNEGRVEVYHSGLWGTVCDDGFSILDARVFCHMLGYSGAEAVYPNAHFGQGQDPIWLDDVACTGHETSIDSCAHKTWGDENCGHSEDVGIRCHPLNVRLVGGGGNYEGRVEISYSGAWYTVCDEGFDDTDAAVVCRMVGFKGGSAEARLGGYFGKGNDRVLLEGLRCSGNETSVLACGRTNSNLGQTSCNHGNDAGVTCSHTPVRLTGGSLPSEGRLEVQHNGVWGSVCSDGFDQADADVVCRMLGFSSSAVAVHLDSFYGNGDGPVWLSDVGCQGNEMDLHQCNISEWANTTCNHNRDVGLKCVPTAIRLVGGLGPWEGRLELQNGGNWGTVCDKNFTQQEANVVCRMLGYTGRDGTSTVLPGGYYGRSSYSTHYDDLNCTGNEIDISRCPATYHKAGTSQCGHAREVGVRCLGAQVRLVGGAHSSEGRVEILHNGVWGSICDHGWDNTDATVVCRMLVQYPLDRNVSGSAFSGSAFGYGDGPVWLSDVSCNGTESDVMACTSDTTGGVNCDHSRDAGVACHFTTEIRLIHGASPAEGTVEMVAGNGDWSSVCDDSWDTKDATVVCRMLGYWSSRAVAYNNSHFGNGNGTAMNISSRCQGNEGDLYSCNTKYEWGKGHCAHGHDAGVKCSATPIGSHNIRLVDGRDPWKGRLEVRYNGQWGSFCYDNWNSSWNNIVCKTLHYKNPNGSDYITNKGLTSIFVKSLSCQGSEGDIGLCKADLDVTSCSHRVVGIDCSGGIKGSISDGSRREGIIYIHDGTPNTKVMCANDVNQNNAKMFCSMAGYSDTSPVMIPGTTMSSTAAFFSVACDGWEQHVSQCTTQPGNNTQCPAGSVARISCFNCTEVYRTSSGSLTSPNYPGNYENNMDCLYSIQPSPFQPHKLVFHDLTLPGDGDFVEIRDENNKQIGRYETASKVPILVGKDFYIRLRSNGAIAAAGFNLSWTPLEIQDAVSMGCGPGGWDIAVNSTILRRLYPNSGVSQIKLSDQTCTGRVLGDLVVFRQSYTECSTKSTTTSSNVVYTNELVYPDSNNPFPLIVHGYRWRLKVECDVTRTDTLENHFKPNHSVVHHAPQVHGSSHYSVDLKFYTDGTFYKEITGNPVFLRTGDDVYVSARLNSDDTHIKMRLDTCTTKPNPAAGPDMTYTLIKHGCVVDRDTTILSQGTHETRFLFNAFEFPANQDEVYVQCSATFCHTSDTSDNCRQTCVNPSIIGRRQARGKIIPECQTVWILKRLDYRRLFWIQTVCTLDNDFAIGTERVKITTGQYHYRSLLVTKAPPYLFSSCLHLVTFIFMLTSEL